VGNGKALDLGEREITKNLINRTTPEAKHRAEQDNKAA
jgi:hypothetical protein